MGVFLIAEHRDAPEVVRYFLRDEASATIGRSDANDLRINSLMLSRQHCQFARRGGEVFVRDLSSASGTRVNGESVFLGTERRVSERDVVRIGDWHIRWERLWAIEDVEVVDPQERAFLESIANDPSDESTRAVYSDWLEEQGDRALEVELLRLDRDLAMQQRPDPSLVTRRRVISSRIENRAWKCIVTRAEVRGCLAAWGQSRAPAAPLGETEACARRWERASPTKHLQVRGCSACKGDIFFASNESEAQSWLETNRRVAVDETS